MRKQQGAFQFFAGGGDTDRKLVCEAKNLNASI
jgi:hypothetical protein